MLFSRYPTWAQDVCVHVNVIVVSTASGFYVTNCATTLQGFNKHYWNIDGSRDLSDSWTGFTQFTLLEEKPPDEKLWSGERLTKRQATSRPDH